MTNFPKDKKQNNENYMVLIEIAKKLEWSKLSYSDNYRTSIFCCPICGGVHPSEYSRHELYNDKRYLSGHFKDCLYNSFEI
jgi:hypothetical protein